MITNKVKPIVCPGDDLENLVLRINDVPNGFPKKPKREKVYAEARKRCPKISGEELEQSWQNLQADYEDDARFSRILYSYGQTPEEVREVLGAHVLHCEQCRKTYVEQILRENVEYFFERGILRKPGLNPLVKWTEKRMKLRDRILTGVFLKAFKLADSQGLNILEKNPSEYHP